MRCSGDASRAGRPNVAPGRVRSAGGTTLRGSGGIGPAAVAAQIALRIHVLPKLRSWLRSRGYRRWCLGLCGLPGARVRAPQASNTGAATPS